MIKILDWYILKKFIGTFFYAIIILAAISCVIDLSEKLDDFVKHKAPILAILKYFFNFVPYIVALLYPLFVFIATIFFTSKMAYKSEVIAILASGTSFQRYTRPYVIGGVVLGLLSFSLNHWLVPIANKSRLRFEDKYVHETVGYSDKNVHIRLSRNLYVSMQSYDYLNNMGTSFTATKVNGTELLEKITADRASYDSTKKIWTLYNVTERHNNGLKEELHFDFQTTHSYPFTPKDLHTHDDKMFAMTTSQLNDYIKLQETRSAENLNVYNLEKYRRSSQPVSGFILTIIGVCIASRRIRGGSGFHLALGIVISAVYIMLMQFSSTFSTNAGLSPMIAVWIPNVLFSIVAIVLYRKQIK